MVERESLMRKVDEKKRRRGNRRDGQNEEYVNLKQKKARYFIS